MEIVFTQGLYDLTKLNGHSWVPLGKNPGIPAALHDLAKHRAKKFQTENDKVCRINCLPWAFSASLALLSLPLKGHVYKWSSMPIRLSGFTLAGQIILRPFQGNRCSKFQKILLGGIKHTLVGSTLRSQSVDQE